jgi:hypothetical protein
MIPLLPSVTTSTIILLLLCAFQHGSNSIKLSSYNGIIKIGENIRFSIFDHNTVDLSIGNRRNRDFQLKSTSETQSQSQTPPVNFDPQPLKREYVPRKYISGSNPIESSTPLPTTADSGIASADGSTPAPPQVSPAIPAGPRIYKPKLATSKFTDVAAATSAAAIVSGSSNADQRPRYSSTQQSTTSYAGSGRGSYSPRSSSSSSSSSGSGVGSGGRSQDTSPAVILVIPHLVVRFRVPREKTEFKKQLEEMQATLAEQSEANRASQVRFLNLQFILVTMQVQIYIGIV